METQKTNAGGTKRRAPRARRDWLLPASVVVAVLLAVVMMFPVIRSMHTVTQYRGFVRDLAESVAYGADNGTLTLAVNGAERSVTNIQAEDLLIVLSRTGPGIPRREPPEDEGLLLTFGDGSTLQLCPTTIRESGRPNDVFVHVRYTGQDGKVCAYDTDQILFQTVRRVLGLIRYGAGT